MKDLRTLFLAEIDLKTIQQNNVQGFPQTKARQHIANLVNANNVKFIPYQQSKNLRVVGTMMSHGHQYTSSIMFDDVEFAPVINNEPGVVQITGTDGNKYDIHPILENEDNVHVNCNCLDFRFRFAQVHDQGGSLDGKPPPPYQRVTQTRPPANPTSALGACKHIIALANKLRQMRILR